MIAAAAAAPPSTDGLPFNWFDVFVVVMLGFGLFRGRRNGMSKELLPVLEWLVLVPLCGLLYPMLAGYLSGFIPDALWRCITAYAALALVVFIVFKILKDQLEEKLVKSDFFKGGEYYLGMLAGMVRYVCVVLFLLALLNAPVYTSTERAQDAAYEKKNFGGGLFAGNYFPHVYDIQDAVFKQSFIGPHLKNGLGILMIDTGQTDTDKEQPDKNAPPPKPKPVIIIGNPTTNPTAPAK